MPSKRPSASAMDAIAPAVPPSPPRSKKRSSRPKPRADDGRPAPNPSSAAAAPSRERERELAHVAPAAPSRGRGRERDRKRRSRASPDLAPASAHPASRGSHGAVQKLWGDGDEVALLAGAAAFRARTGRAPGLSDMAALYRSIRRSISPHLDQDKVYYKLKRLKTKFLHAGPGASSGPHDLHVRDLCADVWGAADLAPPVAAAAAAGERDAARERTVPDTAAMLPVLTDMLDEYWKADGRALSGVSLEKGLSLLGTEEARFVETKWRRQLDAEIQTQMRRHDLAKEVYALLTDAIKGLGP